MRCATKVPSVAEVDPERLKLDLQTSTTQASPVAPTTGRSLRRVPVPTVGVTMYAISLGGDDSELRPLEPWRAEEFLIHIDRGRESIGQHQARLGMTRDGVPRANHLYRGKRYDEEIRSVLAPERRAGNQAS